MENTLRLVSRLRKAAAKAFAALETAGLATGATFVAALWLGVALPGLELVPGFGNARTSSLSISLQSALLGVDDRAGRVLAARAADPRLAAVLHGPSLVSAANGGAGGSFAESPLVVDLRREVAQVASSQPANEPAAPPAP